MTSDLVLDEPDDFDTADLHALSRLVFWAGMLGGRVILSSATITPSLAQGLFIAYREGREHYRRNRGPARPLPVVCAWFDEFGCHAEDVADRDAFAEQHDAFARGRLRRLAQQEIRRKPIILAVDGCPAENEARLDFWAERSGPLLRSCTPPTTRRMRQQGNGSASGWRAWPTSSLWSGRRSACCVTGRRCGNALASLLLPFPISHADAFGAGKRAGSFADAKRRGCGLSGATRRASSSGPFPERDHVVIVMATSVAEVGRDHDYDWAVVEPSSMRSLIQLAGRVRRHRAGSPASPNIFCWTGTCAR